MALFLLLMFGAVWGIFLVVQVVELMGMKDEDFPGHHDKLIWLLAMALLPVVGVIAYWMWKPVRVASPKSLEREWEAMRRK